MTDAELRLACLDRALRVASSSDDVVDIAGQFHDFVRAGSPAQPERGPDGKFRKAHVEPEQAAAAADEAHAALTASPEPEPHNEAPDVLEPKSKLFRWFGGD